MANEVKHKFKNKKNNLLLLVIENANLENLEEVDENENESE